MPGSVPGVAVVGHDALRGLLAHPDVEPGGDLTSALIAARAEDGDRLSITTAVRALSAHPDQLAQVGAGVIRFPTRDLELGGRSSLPGPGCWPDTAPPGATPRGSAREQGRCARAARTTRRPARRVRRRRDRPTRRTRFGGFVNNGVLNLPVRLGRVTFG
jgi:hypothetical protein